MHVYINIYICTHTHTERHGDIESLKPPSSTATPQDPTWKGAQKMMNNPEKFLINLKGI